MLFAAAGTGRSDLHVHGAGRHPPEIALDRVGPDDGDIGATGLRWCAHHVDSVTTQIHQRAAGAIQPPAWVVRGRLRHAHIDLDMVQLTQVTAATRSSSRLNTGLCVKRLDNRTPAASDAEATLTPRMRCVRVRLRPVPACPPPLRRGSTARAARIGQGCRPCRRQGSSAQLGRSAFHAVFLEQAPGRGRAATAIQPMAEFQPARRWPVRRSGRRRGSDHSSRVPHAGERHAGCAHRPAPGTFRVDPRVACILGPCFHHVPAVARCPLNVFTIAATSSAAPSGTYHQRTARRL